MCGISGIYNLNNIEVLPHEITQLNNYLQHRGPDSDGIWINKSGNLALGHRRLSILDLSDAGRQPMLGCDGRFVIVLNGEIYNFIEIRNELKGKGYSFISESDTEVIIYAYAEWGPSMFDKFNGMWALAIYDNYTKNLLLSRDRYGVKPLYYFHDENQFIFSSEITAIHKYLGKKLSINKKIISNILSGSGYYHGTDNTYINEIKSLASGYNININEGKTNINEYYSLKNVIVPSKFDDQAEYLKALLFDACKLRLRSDVKIGTCLSGGVDSGSIASVINEIKSTENARFSKFSHRAFCASFPGTPIDETNAAQRIANQKGLQLDIVNIEPPTPDELEKAMLQCDGPMHALAFFPIWKLYEYIKQQGITVTLDGQGPDEMLGGYNPIYNALEGAWQLCNPAWFYDVYKTYSYQGESSQHSSKKHAKAELKIFFQNKINALRQIYKAPAKYLLHKANLYNYSSPQLTHNDILPSRNQEPFSNSFNNRLYREFFQSPLPGILNQYDRCSMAHGIECRMPFMDYRIVEYIFSLPPQSKVGNGYTKRVLREALKGILPDETRLNKQKLGFNAPIVNWFKGNMKNWIFDQMNSKSFSENPYFNGVQLKKDFENYINSNNSNWNKAWQFWPYVHLAWWSKEINRF